MKVELCTYVSVHLALNQYKPGICFADFSALFISLQAVDDMNGKELNGRQVYVGRAQKKGERQNELKRKFEQMKQDRMTRYQVCWPSPLSKELLSTDHFTEQLFLT